MRHKLALALKQIAYRQQGEPYDIGGRRLRFVPGTRPVRLRYMTSKNDVVRYDALQIDLFSRELVEGDFVIDIGAHAGQYSIIMAAMCGWSGRVIAFEPDPYAREMLIRNLELNPGIKRPCVESAAVSDSPGEAVLYSHSGNANSSLAEPVSGIMLEAEKIPVQLVTLDGYLRDHGLDEPHWVKIDTEGAEIRVLKGARRLLEGRAGIVCELHPYAWGEFGNTIDELKRLAAESGRRIRYLDEKIEIGPEVRYGIVVLERPN